MTITAKGAYGFKVHGADRAGHLLVDVPSDWPSLTLRTRLGFDPGRPVGVNDDEARLRVHDGLIEIDRRRAEAMFTCRQKPTPEALVHPHLAPVAAIASRWRRRESFHAGAVILGDGAWAVMGTKGAGKSSLLAWLALGGHSVVTDDLLVVDEHGNALAGPRSVDLRRGGAERLGVGDPLGVIGARERYRMTLGPVAPSVPLRGFIRLAWGSAATVTSVPPAWRPAELAAQRAVRLVPRDPHLLVQLAALPMVELRRPQEWGCAADAADRLLDTLAG